jgi:2,4-dienoyl-CoA reductase-like NADH-dependent reductase (Old Yellow Enzyme family)
MATMPDLQERLDDIPLVFRPARLGPLLLRNRVIKAATFEGMTPEGLVTDALIGFHRRVALGGVGLTTVAYLAVSPEGVHTPSRSTCAPGPYRGCVA